MFALSGHKRVGRQLQRSLPHAGLADEGPELVCAFDRSGEALCILASWRVDVMVFDEQMPGRAGTEFLRRQCARGFPARAAWR